MIRKILRNMILRRRNKSLMKQTPKMIYGYKHRNVVLTDTRVGSSTSIVGEENLELADNVFIGQFNFIEASNGVTINEGCQITNFISILSHSSHNSIRYYGKEYRKNTELKGYVKGPVVLGKYSFVGPHVTIMPGTTIGKGCIISAYSFVKGDFPDFSIIAGNPATVVGSVRENDEKFISENPELKSYYDEWAKGE